MIGSIRAKWFSVGNIGGSLGFPQITETATFDGMGRYQNFEKGMVSWHPETNAHIVWGLIGVRWMAIGREAFGYPITDELPTPDGVGRYNHFSAVQLPGKSEGSIYFSPSTGAHEVYGGIRAKWASLGWERSTLGYPIDSEQDAPGGRSQHFEHGSLYWDGVNVTIR